MPIKDVPKSKIKMACEQLESAFLSFDKPENQELSRDKVAQKKCSEFQKYFQKIGKQLKDFS